MTKSVVVFADGTGNTVNRHQSNVLRLCQMLDTSEGSGQIAIYDPGLGTTASLAALHEALPPSPRMCVIDDDARQWRWVRMLKAPGGWLFGRGMEENVCQLYRALMRKYEPDQEIYLFGFSRGAFTIRALAGLIYRCGLLRDKYEDQIPRALALCQRHLEGWERDGELRALKAEAAAFKRDCSHACAIRFLGVWDTVKSVGYIHPKTPPHTRHNPIIETVRHALSIGEQRSFYAVTTWGGLDGETRPALYIPGHVAGDPLPAGGPRQHVQEVWFPGDHSDVGGGRPLPSSALADVTLRWMANEAHAAGLRFDEHRYREKIGGRIPTPDDVHDEMADGTWWPMAWNLLEHCPRRDITNEPPPPKLSRLRPKSLGPRKLASTMRHGCVQVHRSAERCIPSAPWKDTLFDFVDTKERILPSAAI